MQSGQASELWQYWQALMSAVGPPWGLVFLMGFFWKRTTEPVSHRTDSFLIQTLCFVSCILQDERSFSLGKYFKHLQL